MIKQLVQALCFALGIQVCGEEAYTQEDVEFLSHGDKLSGTSKWVKWGIHC